jgi:hypothetical protein
MLDCSNDEGFLNFLLKGISEYSSAVTSLTDVETLVYNLKPPFENYVFHFIKK